MTWWNKVARSDQERIKENIVRLQSLKNSLHDLSLLSLSSHSNAYHILKSLLEDRLVLGREHLYKKLESALTGENSQKLVLDSPWRFKQIISEAETIVDREIGKENKELRVLTRGKDTEVRTNFIFGI